MEYWGNSYNFAVGDPNFANVSLLLLGNGANGSTTILDTSPSPKPVTVVGDTQISTAIADPFGNSSSGVIALDGNGDYLTAPANADFSFNGNTQNFTIEFWSYYTGPSSGLNNAQFVGTQSVGGGFQAKGWMIATQGNNYRWFTQSGAGGYDMPLTPNTWEHVAVVCNSAAIKMYVNGVGSSWTLTSNIDYSLVAALTIGGFTGVFVKNYSSNFRITKNVARYTSNFTPPTAPFPDF